MTQILLIEDERGVADAAARVLRDAGREVAIVGSVDEALASLAAETPLVVVLDLVLDRDPAALHAALVKRAVPVLLVSGVEPARLPEIAGPKGWRYLPKPLEPDALTAAVAALIERSTGQHYAVSSSITRDADGRTVAIKSTAQTVSETVVDLAALAIMGAALLNGRVTHPVLQGALVVGILLLAGIRAADLLALSKGLPGRGGPTALLLALVGAAAARVGGA